MPVPSNLPFCFRVTRRAARPPPPPVRRVAHFSGSKNFPSTPKRCFFDRSRGGLSARVEIFFGSHPLREMHRVKQAKIFLHYKISRVLPSIFREIPRPSEARPRIFRRWRPLSAVFGLFDPNSLENLDSILTSPFFSHFLSQILAFSPSF